MSEKCKHYMYQLGILKCDDGVKRVCCDCGAVWLELPTPEMLRVLPGVRLLDKLEKFKPSEVRKLNSNPSYE